MTRLPRSIPIVPVVANLARARSRDRARPQRVAEIQAELLGELVRHAASAVPYYREVYDPAAVAALRGPADLVRLPVLDRKTVVALGPARLLADGHTVESTRMVQEQPGALRIHAVAAPGTEAQVEKQIREVTQPAAAEFDLDVSMVDSVTSERNGKIRLVKRLS